MSSTVCLPWRIALLGLALAGSAGFADEPRGVVGPFVAAAPMELGDATPLAAVGMQPETAVAISRNGRRLAVGTHFGEIRLYEIGQSPRGPRVTLRWRRRMAECLIKQVAFSPDGRWLYYAEQGVDGFLYGASLQAETVGGEEEWRYRLANDLQPGPAPAQDDPFGLFQTPGWYGLSVLDNGDLVALGVHAWGDYRDTSTMRRRSRIYRFASGGEIRWAFPASAAAPVSLVDMAVDPAGRHVVALVSVAGDQSPEERWLKPGCVVALDGATGKRLGDCQLEPLRPYYPHVMFWQSLSISADGHAAAVGLDDGRGALVDLPSLKSPRYVRLGDPIRLGGVAVSARVTSSHFVSGKVALFQTGPSNIAAAESASRAVAPPGPHPFARYLHAVAADSGQVVWRYRNGFELKGFAASGDGRWLLCPCLREASDEEGVPIGGAVLYHQNTTGPGRPPDVVGFYSLAGVPYHRAAMAKNAAAAAVIETPFRHAESGRTVGGYRLHVLATAVESKEEP